ncbi:HAL protein kinase [Hypoxylon sp. FL1150]|nr:HAL protein kinase [Hypoxylon sp. FL1150]
MSVYAITPRFVVDPDFPGGHRHFLESQAHLEKPSRWRSILGNERERPGKRFSLLKLKNRQTKESETTGDANEADLRLKDKYGTPWRVIGRGAYGTVSIFRKAPTNGQDAELFAVKEFRRRETQTPARHSTAILRELALTNRLQHVNVVRIMDLFQSDLSPFYQVMEYCTGGDLFSLIHMSPELAAEEADCFFKQLMRGVKYLHEIGVAHCDLKPENLLLTAEGCLKISDFGCGERIRKSSDDDATKKLSGVRGSTPFIAPEEYTDDEFDGCAADVWACGVIYMSMRLRRYLWRSAQMKDEFYATYIEERREEEGYAPVEAMYPVECRNVVYSLLAPVPSRRLTAAQVLRSEWGCSIQVCEAGNGYQ